MEKKPTYPQRHNSVRFNADNIDVLSLPELDSMLKLVDDLIFAEEKLKDKGIIENLPGVTINDMEKNINFYIEIKEVINFARYTKFQEVFKLPPLPVSKFSL